MPASDVMDYVTALLLLVGGFFAAVAGFGLWRLPDVLMRLHASTKAGTLGACCILLAAAIELGDLATTVRMALAFLFLLLTAPIGAHLIGRAAYRTGTPLSPRTAVDELAAPANGKSP